MIKPIPPKTVVPRPAEGEQIIIQLPGQPAKVIHKQTLPFDTLTVLANLAEAAQHFAATQSFSKGKLLAEIFSAQLSQINALSNTPATLADNLCAVFMLDSIKYPTINQLIHTIVSCEFYNSPARNVNGRTMLALLDKRVSTLYADESELEPESITALEKLAQQLNDDLYKEFESWPHYPVIKNLVGSVSWIKFMKFMVNVIKTKMAEL